MIIPDYFHWSIEKRENPTAKLCNMRTPRVFQRLVNVCDKEEACVVVLFADYYWLPSSGRVRKEKKKKERGLKERIRRGVSRQAKKPLTSDSPSIFGCPLLLLPQEKNQETANEREKNTTSDLPSYCSSPHMTPLPSHHCGHCELFLLLLFFFVHFPDEKKRS